MPLAPPPLASETWGVLDARGGSQGSHDSAAAERRHRDRPGGLRPSRATLSRAPLRRREDRPDGRTTSHTCARIDGDHHVLVAFVKGEPIGLARLVRDGSAAEVAVEVADEWQGRRVGTLLMERLTADARAAGIESLHAVVGADNSASRALMQRAAVRVSTA